MLSIPKDLKNTITIITFLLSGICWFQAVSAEESKTFSIERLVHEARRINPELHALALLGQAAQQDLNRAWKEYLPAPGVSIQAGAEDQQVVFSIRQPIWSGGRISENIELSKEKKTFTSIQTQQQQFVISQDILENIEVALKSDAQINIYEGGLTQLNSLLEMMSRRISSGVSPENEISIVRSRISSMQTTIASLQASKESALDRLTLLTGLPIETSYLQIPHPDELPPHPSEKDSDVIATAIAFSPNIKLKKSQHRQAVHTTKITEASFLPTFYAEGQYSLNNGSKHGDGRIFFGLDYSFNGGLSEIENTLAAQAKTQSAAHEVSVAERNLRAELLTELNSYRSLKNYLNGAQSGLTSSSEVLNSYRRLFLIGEKSWLEVLNAVRENIQIETLLSDAEIKVSITHYKIENMMGELS
jgi:adhesin transport system outer membrane protein